MEGFIHRGRPNYFQLAQEDRTLSEYWRQRRNSVSWHLHLYQIGSRQVLQRRVSAHSGVSLTQFQIKLSPSAMEFGIVILRLQLNRLSSLRMTVSSIETGVYERRCHRSSARPWRGRLFLRRRASDCYKFCQRLPYIRSKVPCFPHFQLASRDELYPRHWSRFE